jgi:predicted membrane-bound mannosyltransferase
MTPDMLFQVSSLFAGIGWLLILFVSPYRKDFDKWVIGIVVVVLAMVYSWLNFSNFNISILKSFSTLAGVAELFQNKDLLNACWVHILALDLLMAVWIKKNSQQLGIRHVVILPSLIFACVFAPLGLLIYLLTRFIVTKKYFAANF